MDSELETKSVMTETLFLVAVTQAVLPWSKGFTAQEGLLTPRMIVSRSAEMDIEQEKRLAILG